MSQRFFIVEDHPVYAVGLRRLLEGTPGRVYAGTATRESEAWAALKDGGVDLVLVDLTLREGSGLGLLQRLGRVAAPPVRVVLTMHSHPGDLATARTLGATAVLTKDLDPAALIAAIDAVAPAAAHGPAEGELLGRIATLTEREREVLRCLGEGLTTREVGERLFISPKTVETHRLHLKEKLGAPTATALVRLAVLAQGRF